MLVLGVRLERKGSRIGERKSVGAGDERLKPGCGMLEVKLTEYL